MGRRTTIPTFQTTQRRATFMMPGRLPDSYGQRPQQQQSQQQIPLPLSPNAAWATASPQYRRSNISPNFLASTRAANHAQQTERATRMQGLADMPPIPPHSPGSLSQPAAAALQQNQLRARAAGLSAGGELHQQLLAQNDAPPPLPIDALNASRVETQESIQARNIAQAGYADARGAAATTRADVTRDTADIINPARAGLLQQQATESQSREALNASRGVVSQQQAATEQARQRNLDAGTGYTRARTNDPARFRAQPNAGQPRDTTMQRYRSLFLAAQAQNNKAEMNRWYSAMQQYEAKQGGQGLHPVPPGMATTQPTTQPMAQPFSTDVQHNAGPMGTDTTHQVMKLTAEDVQAFMQQAGGDAMNPTPAAVQKAKELARQAGFSF